MKILMVCLGNICRSPLAHGILQTEINQRGLDWEVDSAGTSGFHNGEAPDIRSQRVAIEHGVDISNQRSRQVTKSDFDSFDLLIAMDTSNYNNLLNLAPTAAHKEKVKMLLNYSFPNQNRVVPDPYYEGGFDHVYNLINEAIQKLIHNS